MNIMHIVTIASVLIGGYYLVVKPARRPSNRIRVQSIRTPSTGRRASRHILMTVWLARASSGLIRQAREIKTAWADNYNPYPKDDLRSFHKERRTIVMSRLEQGHTRMVIGTGSEPTPEPARTGLEPEPARKRGLEPLTEPQQRAIRKLLTMDVAARYIAPALGGNYQERLAQIKQVTEQGSEQKAE